MGYVVIGIMLLMVSGVFYILHLISVQEHKKEQKKYPQEAIKSILRDLYEADDIIHQTIMEYEKMIS